MGIWDRNGDAEWDSGTTGVTKLEIERMCAGGGCTSKRTRDKTTD